MGLPKIITTLVVICVAAVAAVIFMGPKLGLQLPPIEKKAEAYLEKHKLIARDEHLTGYKAISLYDYSHAAVITDKRIFMYNGATVHSIPLEKITLVNVRDTELGRQAVLISAQQNGSMSIEISHKSVPELIKILKVHSSIVKYSDESKHMAVEKAPKHVTPAKTSPGTV
jgi:hypothetical protein